MIESIGVGLSAAVLGLPSATSGGSSPDMVAALDVQRFRSAFMGAQPAGAPAAPELISSPALPASALPAGLAAPAASVPSARSAAQPTIGESILSGLRDVSEDTRVRYTQIAEVLKKPSPSVSDLLGLQFTMIQASLQFELTSKLISKAPQTIDAILKAQ